MTSRVRTIFIKEFREIFRDRRTTFSVVISPLLITPLMFAIIGMMIENKTNSAKTEVYRVGIVQTGTSWDQMDKIGEAAHLKFVPVTQAEAERRIHDKDLKAAVVIPNDVDSSLAADKTARITLLMDEGNESSRMAAGRLRQLFTETGRKVVEQRLSTRGLSPQLADPFHLDEQPIKQGGAAGMIFLGMLLPYTLAISAFSGGIYAANDQVAGEKERGTLETLLVSPASRREIVFGKFGAVVGVCLVSSLLSVVGLIIPFVSGFKAFHWMTQGGVTFHPSLVLVTVLVQVPLAVLFAGVLLALSTFARNQKEAQTYLGPLFLFVMMPSMLSMFVGSDNARPYALIPILNSSLIIKQALANIYDPVFIAMAFFASVVYAAIALSIATRLFNKESVLLKA